MTWGSSVNASEDQISVLTSSRGGGLHALPRVSRPQMTTRDSETHQQVTAEAWPWPLRPRRARRSLSLRSPSRVQSSAHPAESLAQAAGLATQSSGRPTRTPGSGVQHGRGQGRNKPQGEPVVILYNEQFCFICSFVKSLENGGMTTWQVGTVLGPAESRSP